MEILISISGDKEKDGTAELAPPTFLPTLLADNQAIPLLADAGLHCRLKIKGISYLHCLC